MSRGPLYTSAFTCFSFIGNLHWLKQLKAEKVPGLKNRKIAIATIAMSLAASTTVIARASAVDGRRPAPINATNDASTGRGDVSPSRLAVSYTHLRAHETV